jgi:Leucine-rich repeat (LRR) protein
MKMIFFSLMLLILTSVEVNAQSCKKSCPYYADFVKRAQADTVKNAQTKLNYYRAAIVAAKDCHCPELEQSAYQQIDTLFILIEEEKRMAEAQAQTILEQQSELETTLTKTKAANEKSIKIINAMDFYDGKFALALKNGKYGFIDKDGNTTIGFEYDKGAPFDSETGFAEMEIIDKSTNKGVKYLVDTIGNRYQLFRINEEYLLLLKNKLAKNKKQAKLEGEEFNLKSVNEVLAYELNKSEEKIALGFYYVKHGDVSNILQYLAKDSKINSRIEFLTLCKYTIYKFPDIIAKFKKLKYVDIKHTYIVSIPKTIDRLKDLKVLKLPEDLKRIPFSLYNLENLEKLDLFFTGLKMKTLPKTINQLIKLKELLVPEHLETFPESICDLINLERLEFEYTELEVIPEAIGNLKKLKSLKLPSTLKKVPSSIYNLENLEILDLDGTDDNEIPDAIGNLKKLKELYILFSLEKLPESIGNLINIKILQLDKTELKVLPENIGKLVNLNELWLPPSLEKLPESIGNLINLERLGIEDNQNLKNIPDISKMKKLENFYFTLYKDENYVVNLEKLKELQRKLPNCDFDIMNENGSEINVEKR